MINLTYQFYILNLYGVNDNLDVFFASNTFNLIIVTIASSSINFALTPIFIKFSKEKSQLFTFASSIFNIFLLFFAFLSIMQFIYAESIITLLLPGFSSINTELTVKLFKYQAFLSVFSILSSILTSLHYTYGNLFRTIICPIIGNATQFFFVWFFSDKFGLYALLYGLIISQSLNFILLSTSFIKVL